MRAPNRAGSIVASLVTGKIDRIVEITQISIVIAEKARDCN